MSWGELSRQETQEEAHTAGEGEFSKISCLKSVVHKDPFARIRLSSLKLHSTIYHCDYPLWSGDVYTQYTLITCYISDKGAKLCSKKTKWQGKVQGEEEDKIKTNIFWSECVTLVLQSPPSVWVYSHRQPLKETLGTRVHLSWDMDQGLERLSWLNHQGPLTDKQTFGSCRPTNSSTNSFRTKKSAGTLYNSGSISVRGEKLQVDLVNYRPWYGPSQSAMSLPRPLKCHGVHNSYWAEAILEGNFPNNGKVTVFAYGSKAQPNFDFACKIPTQLRKCLNKTRVYHSSHNTGAPDGKIPGPGHTQN